MAKKPAKKKVIGYTESDRKSMRQLIERTEPMSGDYVGSGTVTTVKKRGGGLARKGMGVALAKGGIVKSPARSYRDMKAGAGSGVGRIQKTKIAGRGR